MGNIGDLRFRAGGQASAHEVHGVGVRAGRISLLGKLSVEKQLGAQVASRGRIDGALGVRDETALFAEDSTLLDI